MWNVHNENGGTLFSCRAKTPVDIRFTVHTVHQQAFHLNLTLILADILIDMSIKLPTEIHKLVLRNSLN